MEDEDTSQDGDVGNLKVKNIIGFDGKWKVIAVKYWIEEKHFDAKHTVMVYSLTITRSLVYFFGQHSTSTPFYLTVFRTAKST